MITKEIRILGIIPARGGSKGIPYKNIAKLNGKPLIYYTIEAAKKSKLLDTFIVSTDDKKIARVAKSYGADVPFLRPKQISGDNATDIQFLKHAVRWVSKNRKWNPEIIVLLRPTAPLRTAEDIDDALKLIIKENCDSVRTISIPTPFNPYKMWKMENDSTAKIKPLLATKYYKTLGTDVPRQWLPTVYWQNGLVDVTKTKFIKANRVYGPDIRGIITDPNKITDIDTLKDLRIVEAILKISKNEK